MDLTCKDVCYSIKDKKILDHVSINVDKQRFVTILGPNGCGKTTLLKNIYRVLKRDSGEIVFNGKSIDDLHLREAAKKIAVVAQFNEINFDCSVKDMVLLGRTPHIPFMQSETHRDYEIVEDALQKVGMLDKADRSYLSLSGGEKQRVALARAIAQQPTLLLLDEPTNHLDDEHIKWLVQFLQDFNGTYLVVSHDQQFLNQITTHIIDIEFGKLTKYTGNLEKSLKLKALQNESYLKQYEAQQAHIKKTEAYIRKYKAGSRSTMAKSREKQLAKIERLTPPTDAPTPHIAFPYAPIVTTLALETTHLEIGYDKPLLSPIDLTIRYGEKIAIRGFNGIGKSTLIKTLLGQIPAINGSVSFPQHTKFNYFSQDLTWEQPLQNPLHYMSDKFPKATIKELRRQLSRAGLPSQLAQEALKSLSGGEQTKVKLAEMMMIKSNFLLLDEPTNHIDQATKDNLNAALADFQGTVLVVSHEADFYEDFADRIIELSE